MDISRTTLAKIAVALAGIVALLSPGIALAARTDALWDFIQGGNYLKPNATANGADLLIYGINHYLNFNTVTGSSGYGFRDNAGTMEFKNSGGAWTGIGSGGGANSTINWTGLATTSQPASSNLLVSNGSAGVYGVATSTLSAGSGLSGSFTQLGSGGSVSCATASGSVFGCLASADWTTFNGKVGASRTINTTYPLQGGGDLSADRTLTLAFGTTTSNTWAGAQTFTNSPVFSTLSAGTVNAASNGTLYNTATSSLTNGTGISFTGTPGALIGGTNLTITNSGVTSIIVAGAGNTGGVTFATSTSAFNGITSALTITSSLNTVTFTPSLSGTLSVGGGGTGQATFSSSQLLYGNGSNALTGVGTTTPTLGLGLSGTLTTINNAAQSLSIATSSLYTGTIGQFPYFSGTNTLIATSSIYLATSQNVGIGTTTPSKLLTVYGDQSGGIFRVQRKNSATTGNLGTMEMISESSGQMTDGFGSGLSFLAQDADGVANNAGSIFFVRDGGDTSYAVSIYNALSGSLTENLHISASGKVGLASSTPFASLSVQGAAGVWPFSIGSSTASLFGVNDYGAVTLTANQPATSTSMTLDWSKSGQQVEYRIGFSATTITLINATTTQYWGTTKRVYVCNPGGAAGALTWTNVEWIGTAPTQTTTANQCDMYFFNVTRATSTTAYKVAGQAGTGFQ